MESKAEFEGYQTNDDFEALEKRAVAIRIYEGIIIHNRHNGDYEFSLREFAKIRELAIQAAENAP